MGKPHNIKALNEVLGMGGSKLDSPLNGLLEVASLVVIVRCDLKSMSSPDNHVIERVVGRVRLRCAWKCAVMSDIPKLLLDSLNPHTRKQAEHALDAYSRQPAFVVHLLQLVLATTNDTAVRLAASVYLKNRVRLGWLDDVRKLFFLIHSL